MHRIIALIALWFTVTPLAQGRTIDDGSPPFTVAASSVEPSFSDQYLSQARNLVLYAMGFLGINYKYGGSSPETGFDCSGLVNYVFNHALGLILPRDSYAISRSGSDVARDELQPGDLVFFNTMRRPFSHVGIYLGEQRFIHSPSSGGQVEIVSMANRYWQQRYNGARRIGM
jgi:cell wall-associated NlpC family hydrolase